MKGGAIPSPAPTRLQALGVPRRPEHQPGGSFVKGPLSHRVCMEGKDGDGEGPEPPGASG